MTTRLARRTFLRGAAGVSIGLPLLEAMLPRLATAGVAPRRLVTLFSANGTIHNNFHPGSDGPLGSLPVITAKFEPLKAKLLLLRGIKMFSALNGVGNGHVQGMASNLTGIENKTWPSGAEYATGPSMDQLIAARIGKETPFPSLEIGFGPTTGTGNVRSYVSYRGAGQPMPVEADPKKLFDRVFANSSATGGAATAGPVSRRPRVVLDAVLDDLRVLNVRLGPGDRKILDEHLTSIREIERRLTAPPPAVSVGCVKPATPPTVGTSDAQYPMRTKLFLDLTVRILACDLTRVVTFMWTGSGGKGLSWLGISNGHHPLAHANAVPELTKLESWYAEQTNAFALGLDGVREGDRSLLDNSAVFWTHEIAQGPLHPRNNLHYAILGSCGGAFKSGRAMSFGDQRSQNDLLLTFMHAMGLTDVKTIGNPTYNNGPLALG
jgi:hypothetical protein